MWSPSTPLKFSFATHATSICRLSNDLLVLGFNCGDLIFCSLKTHSKLGKISFFKDIGSPIIKLESCHVEGSDLTLLVQFHNGIHLLLPIQHLYDSFTCLSTAPSTTGEDIDFDSPSPIMTFQTHEASFCQSHIVNSDIANIDTKHKYGLHEIGILMANGSSLLQLVLPHRKDPIDITSLKKEDGTIIAVQPLGRGCVAIGTDSGRLMITGRGGYRYTSEPICSLPALVKDPRDPDIHRPGPALPEYGVDQPAAITCFSTLPCSGVGDELLPGSYWRHICVGTAGYHLTTWAVDKQPCEMVDNVPFTVPGMTAVSANTRWVVTAGWDRRVRLFRRSADGSIDPEPKWTRSYSGSISGVRLWAGPLICVLTEFGGVEIWGDLDSKDIKPKKEGVSMDRKAIRETLAARRAARKQRCQ